MSAMLSSAISSCCCVPSPWGWPLTHTLALLFLSSFYPPHPGSRHNIGCQTTYAEIIGGLPYYFPAYGTAAADASGNFVCNAGSYKLHPSEGRFVKGALPYNIAVES